MKKIELPDARRSDPETSHGPGRRSDAKRKRRSQRERLLAAYNLAAWDGLTDEEAGRVTGLYVVRSCCYWKRCSELRAGGLIMPLERDGRSVTRTGPSGHPQRVCRITSKGLLAIRAGKVPPKPRAGVPDALDF